jgi:hypothetical protein
MGLIRTFTLAERQRIAVAAEKRIANHPKQSSFSFAKDDDQRELNERLGIAGEWAVADWLKLDDAPIWRDCGRGGDKGKDLIRYGEIVSVKTTRKEKSHARLSIPYYDEPKAVNVLVCVAPSPPYSLEPGGFLFEDDFHRLADFFLYRGDPGPAKFVHASQLEALEEIVPEPFSVNERFKHHVGA